MSSVSGIAAFYQFFRDRETGATPSGGNGAGQVAPGAAPGAADGDGRTARDAGTAALTPAQVRERLAALIAGQVATGKLTDGQGAALRQALSTGAGQDPPAAAAPADASASRGGETGADGARDPGEVLATFIENLQAAQAPRASYGSDGSAPARSAGSRLLDFNT